VTGGNVLTQAEIESMLVELGFDFVVHGTIVGPLGFSSLRAPRPAGIYFLAAGARLPESARGSLVLAEMVPPLCDDNAYIEVRNPQLVFYALMGANQLPVEGGSIHPTAIIDPTANVSATARVGPYCVIEARTDIGAGCHLDSHVVIKAGSVLGERVVIEPHSTIGATGVAWVWDERGEKRVIQPQTGGVRIGNDVFLGSDVSVVRGSVNEMTEIGGHTVVAHGSKIGHGCRVGEQVHLANNVSLAGNVDVGNRVFFGSGAVVRPRVSIVDGVVIGAGAVVVKDIETRNVVVGGVPAKLIGTIDRKLTGVPEPPRE